MRGTTFSKVQRELHMFSIVPLTVFGSSLVLKTTQVIVFAVVLVLLVLLVLLILLVLLELLVLLFTAFFQALRAFRRAGLFLQVEVTLRYKF